MIEFKSEQRKIICKPKENLIATNVPALRAELINKLDIHDWSELIFDCSEVETLDSIGVNLLVGLFKRAESDKRKFKLVGCNDTIKKVLDLFHLNQKLQVED